MSKGAYYSRLDADTLSDIKVIKLISYNGLEGLGFYLGVLTIMRNLDTHKMKRDDFIVYKGMLQIDTEKVNYLLDECIKYELFTENNDGFIFSKSFLKQMKKVDEMISKKSIAGKKSGESRRKKALNTCSTDVPTPVQTKPEHMLNEERRVEESREEENRIEEERKKKELADKGKKSEEPKVEYLGYDVSNYNLPDFVDKSLFQDFLIIRKSWKAQVTPNAFKLMVNLFNKHPNLSGQILEASIMNNWKGLFPPKVSSFTSQALPEGNDQYRHLPVT